MIASSNPNGYLIYIISVPLLIVLAVSVVTGLLMVILFRFTSNQKAIGRAKDQLKAHLLAVRLFQDQLAVVLRAYIRIIGATGRYLRLAFTSFLIGIVPIIFLVIQLDRYLGWLPLPPAQSFLVEVQTDNPQTLNELNLTVPEGLEVTSPPVHIPHENKIAWRVKAEREGKYDVSIVAADKVIPKQVVVSARLARISLVRLRGNFWERMLSSGEPALPDDSPIQSVAVNYAPRNISFAWMEWNWIVLFFVLSLVAGFIFKTVFRIQI